MRGWAGDIHNECTAECLMRASAPLFSVVVLESERKRARGGWAERSWRTARLQRPHRRTKDSKVNAPSTSSPCGLDDTRTRKKSRSRQRLSLGNESSGGGGGAIWRIVSHREPVFPKLPADALDSCLRNST